jgi:hypothetical protein
MSLRLKERDIFSDLMNSASQLRKEWHGYKGALDRKGPLPPMPKTLFELAYDDITAKSKTIALAAMYGPYWTKTWAALEKRAREQMLKQRRPAHEIERAASQAHAIWQRVLEAKDPDDFDEMPRQ